MADTHASNGAEGSRMRARPSAKPLHLHNSDDARQKVLQLNEEEGKGHGDGGEKRTYGRTPDGTGTYLAAASPSRRRGAAVW
jgi:phosphatidylethanolamine N-methyltransferase